MRNRVANRWSPGQMVLLAVVAITAVVVPLVIGVVSALALQNPEEPPVAFEVASVRPAGDAPRPGFNMASGPGCGMNGLQIDPKRIAITAPLYTLIYLAYGGNCRVPELLTGESDWMRSTRYDIEAVIPEGTPVYTPIQLANRDAPKLQKMFQALLADRFRLKVHYETKELSALVLTVANGGPKLTPWSEGEPGIRRINGRRDQDGQPYGELVAGKASLAALAEMLSLVTNQLVLDRTGLKGDFNVTVEFDNNGVARPVISTALREQAGLKLEGTKASVDVQVIDHAERPSEN